MSARIVFNDKEYASVEEMPPEVRRAYQELVALLAIPDRNPAADLAAESGGEPKLNLIRLRFLHDGKEYSSLEEMPPEARRQYQAAVTQPGEANREGIRDTLQDIASPGNIGESRRIVVRTTQNVRVGGVSPLGSVKSLLLSVGTSALLAALAALVALAVLVLWKLL